MEYISEIREIVSEYDRIRIGVDGLDKRIQELLMEKNEFDKALELNKKKESALTDKIVQETGQKPDYYNIMLELYEKS